MNAIGFVALLAWPVAAVLLASWLRAPRAAVATCIAAWLFLPEGGMDLPGPVDLSKINVTTLSMLAALALVEPRRILAFRPSWADLPIAALCVCSFFSSLANGLGAYDGVAESLAKTFAWGIPWIVGRACFRTLDELRVLAIGIVLGGLVYIPLCLYEVRMSPQLHRILYGFFPHAEFSQSRRFGGFRPNVFMQHGLMVALWMAASAVTGAWLWHAGRLRVLLRLQMSMVVPAQIAVAVLCKSAGAAVLMAGGVSILLCSKWLRARALLWVLALAAPVYVAYRVAGGPTDAVVQLAGAAPLVSERVDSLAYRFEAEDILLAHAKLRPIFGWGGYGRHRPVNEAGEELARTDSLWIITLGQNGIVGLTALYAALATPLWMVARRVPFGAIFSARGAPLLVLALLVAMFAADSLFNAMFNPVYVMAGGGVVATLEALRARACRGSAGASRGSLTGAGRAASQPRGPKPGPPIGLVRGPEHDPLAPVHQPFPIGAWLDRTR